MSIKLSMWVQGTAVEAEREGYHISSRRYGWGRQITSHGDEWFHAAIPTPVIFGGKESKLLKAFVFFKTTMSTKIIDVHLYDGKTKFKEFNGLNLSGSHDGSLDQSNTFQVNPVHVRYGLGLSVHVDFGKSTPQGVPSITFAAAGADFVIPN